LISWALVDNSSTDLLVLRREETFVAARAET